MGFLLFWTTWVQVTFIIVTFSGVSILGLYAVRRLVPVENLKQNHEVAGFTFGVIGAFYGLLLAFVIVAAWQRFDRADDCPGYSLYEHAAADGRIGAGGVVSWRQQA